MLSLDDGLGDQLPHTLDLHADPVDESFSLLSDSRNESRLLAIPKRRRRDQRTHDSHCRIETLIDTSAVRQGFTEQARSSPLVAT
jgi:hypothetical protein